jgi:hypothetical protein
VPCGSILARSSASAPGSHAPLSKLALPRFLRPTLSALAPWPCAADFIPGPNKYLPIEPGAPFARLTKASSTSSLHQGKTIGKEGRNTKWWAGKTLSAAPDAYTLQNITDVPQREQAELKFRGYETLLKNGGNRNAKVSGDWTPGPGAYAPPGGIQAKLDQYARQKKLRTAEGRSRKVPSASFGTSSRWGAGKKGTTLGQGPAAYDTQHTLATPGLETGQAASPHKNFPIISKRTGPRFAPDHTPTTGGYLYMGSPFDQPSQQKIPQFSP